MKVIPHIRLPINEKGRDIFVGDIHGRCYDLKHPLEDLNFDFEKDRLICTGDLIDRGRCSIDTAHLLEADWFYSVVGNHEEMLYHRVLGDKIDADLHSQNGGEWADVYSIERLTGIMNLIIKHCPLAITVPQADGREIGVVHATVFNGDWDDQIALTQYEDFCTWDGSKYRERNDKNPVLIKNIDCVVSGHINKVTEGPIGNTYFIDSSSYPSLYIVSADTLLGTLKKEKNNK